MKGTDTAAEARASSRVRIVVADDHEVVRQGLLSVLKMQPGWEVCGEASTGREAVELVTRLKPDVVVLDISMPEMNGLEAARQILKATPQTEILILTIHESEQVIREVLATGARAYVLKSDAGRNLVAAVDALRQHKPFFTSKVSEMVLDGYLRQAAGGVETEPVASRLTPREREIVQLLTEGKSNKETGAVLGISVKTVETHRASIMRKLNLQSFSELVRYAIRNRIIQA